MALALILVPAVVALLALAVPSSRSRPWLLPVAGAAHLALTARALTVPDVSAWGGWLWLDPVGRLVLGLISLLFFVCAVYAVGYLRLRPHNDNRVFCACLLLQLSTMTLIVLSHHLGLLWVALEACTLASAPLIYFHRNPRSLEALWKYLLIGSVGIAIALLGSFFLAYSALHAGHAPSLLLEDLTRDAPTLSRSWLHAAFVLLFIGYGTKMGLAPMHTWKPDTYGEATGLVGTMLAGGVTLCAFTAILRFYKILSAAGDGAYGRGIMVAAGLFSMAVAGVFMARQRDYKRMLAYSSVEHMGILILGIGLGGGAAFGALLHALNNGLTKGVLFLSAGNIHRVYGSKLTGEVRGALRRLPASAALFLAGFFAITGAPPFGPFLSELTILRGAFVDGRYAVAGLFLLALLFVFVGMGSTVLAVVQGEPPEDGDEGAGPGSAAVPSATSKVPSEKLIAQDRAGDTPLTVVPIAVLLSLVLLLGLYIPPPVGTLLRDAAAWLEAP
jgi:hydrogenase-4 component F